MDGAQLLAGELAQDKAYTVASFGMATHQWWEFIREEPSLLHGVPKTDRLVIYGGGLPILAGDALVGAIGVAGGLPDQDREVAAAGVRACEDVLGVPA
jgi:uncharacterized protein GlcG (DUF336 family)